MATATSNLAHGKGISAPALHASARGKIECEYLRECEFGEWDQFIERSPHGTIFHSSWWLEIVASSYRLLAVRDREGRIRAGLPLPAKNMAGLRLFHSPSLAPYLGPVFEFSDEESERERLRLMREYGELLARRVSGFDSLRYVVGAAGPDLEGFTRAGFRLFLGYTFRFAASQTLEEISKGISRTHMQKLNKAQRLGLQVLRDDGLETLLSLNKMTFKRQGAAPPYSDDTVTRLWNAAASRGRANLYVAVTAEKQPVAGLLTVHDRCTTTQIISGINPEFSDVPGQNLVLWSAIQDALHAGRAFDFEGSELRGVEAFYRRWGAAACPVWRIEKAGTLRGFVAQAALCYLSKRDERHSSWTRSEGK